MKTARNKHLWVSLVSFPETLGKCLHASVFSRAGQQWAVYSRMNTMLELFSFCPSTFWMCLTFCRWDKEPWVGVGVRRGSSSGQWGWDRCVQVSACCCWALGKHCLEREGENFYGKRQHDCWQRPADLREGKTGLMFNLFCGMLLPSAAGRMLQPCPVKSAVLVLENFLRRKPQLAMEILEEL